jgi:thiopurine S-methyltransferase
MEPKFWREKWATNQIGFHEDVFHESLCEHWESFGVERRATVFVPLCGKSKDMVWLRERGHQVVGIELSEIAVQAFFDENGLSAERDEFGPFSRYRGGGYTLLCGDIFDLTREFLGPFAALYDRAALIALPPETRRAYVEHVRTLCEVQTLGLLITISYPPEAVSPPPFLVPPEEVDALYGSWCEITPLGTGPTQVKGVAGTHAAFRLRVQ